MTKSASGHNATIFQLSEPTSRLDKPKTRKKSNKNPKGAKKNTKEHLKKKKRKKNNERKNVNKLIYSRYPISRTAWGSFLLLSFIKDDWNAFRSDTI